MNYEDFYLTVRAQEKIVSDGLAGLQKLSRAVGRETENGDIRGMIKDAESMRTTAADLLNAIDAMRATVDAFDIESYYKSGEFTAQLLDACRAYDIDVREDAPIYEMFPYRVRVDEENQEIYLDRKKIPCVRPQKFAQIVRDGQEKLKKVSFNAQKFADELAEAYDLAVMKQNLQSGTDIYLNSLYKIMTLMSRFRKDYDKHSFAFDLARLYASRLKETKSGRRFQFGPSRKNGKAIRILDEDGKEQFLATIRFYE